MNYCVSVSADNHFIIRINNQIKAKFTANIFKLVLIITHACHVIYLSNTARLSICEVCG